MGVVKNLMVRVGADLSGLVSGFKKAGGATGSFAQKASKDLTSLKGSLSKMTGAYASISEAAKSIDLTKSVSKQISEANKELGTLEKTAADLEDKLAFWSEIEPAGMQYKTQELREALGSVDGQIDTLYYKLQRLENVKILGESVGIKDVTFSSLNKLQMDIAETEDELRRAEGAAEDTADATRNLGNSAKSAGSKVKTASGWIGGLRKNAKASSLSVSDLTRSLRRVGVAAVGIKLAGAVLGEFRSLVTGYISQNETMQAKVDELKAGFGQALAPAINVATNALSKMMPYILGVSNAIGELITNLFGSGWTTVAAGATAAAAATGEAADAQNAYNRTLAGFDQITKLGSGSSSAGSTSSTIPVNVQMPAWLSELPAKLKDAVLDGDYKGFGAALADALNEGIKQATQNDTSLGKTIAQVIQGGIDAVDGFVSTLDWSKIPELIKTNIKDLITGIDWSTVFHAAGATAGGLGAALWRWLSDEISSIWTSFQAEIDEAGGNIFQAVLNALIKAVENKNKWVQENIVAPLIDGFKAGFTGSISLQELLDQGGSIVEVGIKLWKDGWSSIQSFIGDALSVYTSLKKSGWTSLSSFIGDSLKVSIELKKGWTGTLAKALGIESITSKLNLSLPEIAINWKTVTVLGKDFKYPTGFDVKWNAMGAILDGAQIFGRVGNTFLGGGEAGREALLPLDRNTGWMDKIADRVANRISSGNGGEQNLVIYLTLDGKVVTKTVIRNINAQAKATGKNPLAAYM